MFQPSTRPLARTLAAVLAGLSLWAVGCQTDSDPGSPATTSTTPTGPVLLAPPRSPADPAIAFRSGNNLRVMNADGSNATTVYTGIPPGTQGMNPSWSPSGTRIALMNDTHDLWRIDVSVVGGTPQGTNPTELLDRSTSLFHAQWSPLGDQIAFVDINLYTLEALPVSGGPPMVLYTGTTPVHSPTFSPDASRIAFTEAGSIKLLERSSGTVTTVLGSDFGAGFSSGVNFLDWGRASDVLVFSVGSKSRADTGIYTVNVSGGTPTFLVEGLFPSWSPDDSKVVFVELERGGNLAIFELARQRLTRFTKVKGDWPDWRRF